MNELHTEHDGHEIQPVKDSFYTQAGLPANLFRSSDYPVEAVCQVCSMPIIAESYLKPFEHFSRDLQPEP